jgi:hypothetical protein
VVSGAGLSIALFSTLTNLRVIRMSKADFEADCRGASAPHTSTVTTHTEPAWKRWARAVFSALFTLVWLDGVSFFYVHRTSVRDGSTIPTAMHSVRLVEHGRVIYIRPAQEQLRSILQTIAMTGGPLMAMSALVPQYLIGVRLYPTRRSE